MRPALTSAIITLALSAASAAVAQPDLSELRTVRPLTDQWRFVQDDGLSDEAALAATAADWEVVALPHTWNAVDAATPGSNDYERGIGWYRLEFTSPVAGARHWLEFGAASLVADVWLNSQYLGKHEGGFTAFRFDVTDHLAPSTVSAPGSNVLLVKTDNSIPQQDDDPTAIAPLGGDYNKSGGLYRHVELISTPSPVHFALDDLGGPGVYAATTSVTGVVGASGAPVDPAAGAVVPLSAAAAIDVRAKLAAAADAAAGDYLVRIALADAAGGIAASAEQVVTIAPGMPAEAVLSLDVPSAHLWHGVADPYLYQLSAELVDPAGTPIDRVVQSFGIREMRFDPNEGFFLNGQPIRLHGVAMHQDFEGRGWALTAEHFDASFALIDEIGANAVRLGHYPFGEYPLQKASELGLVAWAERPSGYRTHVDTCTPSDPTSEFVENAVLQTRELIRQQYNHAAVAMWSIGNETSFGQVGCDAPFDDVTPLLRTLHDVAKEEDPIRPTVYAEFPHPVEREGPFATEGITDLFATNRYFLWYQEPLDDFSPLLDALHALTPSQPLAVSEYGGGSAIDQHTDNPLGGLPEVHSADDDQPSSFQAEEYASFLHEQVYAVIAGKPYLWGSFVWNMFDFGSSNRNEGGTLGINTKGLVTFNRQTRKDPFFFYKANWSGEPVTYITSRRYTDRAYAVVDVKVYSNADSVELAVNGTPVASLTADQCVQMTCVFEDVSLASGVNTVTATGNHGAELVTDSVEWTVGDPAVVNISAGMLQSGYVATDGTRFGSDEFFTGGRGGQTEPGDAEGFIPDDLAGTDDPLLYKYFRVGEFRYDIPLPAGRYDVTLGFIEPDPETEAGGRVFSVTANGVPVMEDFEIINEAGAARTAVTHTFAADVPAGVLTLEFVPSEGEALVSLIRIAPGGQGVVPGEAQ